MALANTHPHKICVVVKTREKKWEETYTERAHIIEKALVETPMSVANSCTIVHWPGCASQHRAWLQIMSQDILPCVYCI